MTVGDHPTALLWDQLPSAVDPSEGVTNMTSCVNDDTILGHLPSDRAQRKRQQIENIVHHVRQFAPKSGDVIVDFCAGGVSILMICFLLIVCDLKQSLILQCSKQHCRRANNGIFIL